MVKIIKKCAKFRNFIIKRYFSTERIREVYESSYLPKGPRINFSNFGPEFEECVLSKEEAVCLLKMCLKDEYFNPKLYRNCINVIENEYFKPVLVNENARVLDDFGCKNPQQFIDNLTIKDKALLVLWNGILQTDYTHLNEPEPSIFKPPEQSIDPERDEAYVTRKVGRVMNPKPIRARVRSMAPGKKISNLIAFQLREAIQNASLSDLCYISLIFSTRLPLTGQLNEDTIELLAQELCKFTPQELATELVLLSQFCHAATIRFQEIWSFQDPNVNRKPNANKCLYKIERKRLPKEFINKFIKALEIYTGTDSNAISKNFNEIKRHEGLCNSLNFSEITSGRGGVENSDTTSGSFSETEDEHPTREDDTSQPIYHLVIMRNLSYSDIPISLQLWDSLVYLLQDLLKDSTKIDLLILSLYCECVNTIKYTSKATVALGLEMVNRCHVEDFNYSSHILKFIKVHKKG